MNIDHLLYIVLFSQIMFISYYYPSRMLIWIHSIFENYSPNEFPKLYPESIEKYKKSAKHYQIINHLIMVLGFGLILWLNVAPRNVKWDQEIVAFYFMIQLLPILGTELWSMKYLKAMRLLNQDAKKEAVLQPRRLTDFCSMNLLGTAVVIYIIFVGFSAYFDQFDYPWFDGYLNVLMISGAFLIFGIIGYRAMYGKVKNPHQSYENRKTRIQTLIRQLLSISIAVMLYVMLEIPLKVFGLESFIAISISLYFHVIVALYMQFPRLDSINFDVYKNKLALTKT